MSMSPDEINVAIAELLGWHIDDELEDGAIMGTQPGGGWDMVPNFHGSLDSCAKFEATLEGLECEKYMGELESVCGAIRSPSYTVYFATAPQRCEAFLRVKGKWVG